MLDMVGRIRGNFGVVFGSIAVIPLFYYGFAFHKACIAIHSLPAAGVPGGAAAVATGPVNAIVALTLAALVWKLGSSRMRTVLFPAGLFCLAVSNLMLAAAYFWGMSNWSFLAASMVVHACGTLSVSALWIDLYARLNPIRATFLNAVSVVVAQVLIFFTEENSIPRVFLMILLLFALAALFYWVAMRKSEQSGEMARPAFSDGRERFPVPYTAVAFIAACSFAYGVANVASPGTGARYTSVIPSLIVIAFVLLNTKRFDMSMLLRIALPLLIAGFLLVTFVSGVHPVPSAVLDAGFASIEMLLLLMVCTISYSTGASAIWLFGLMSAAQFGLRHAGALLGRHLEGLADPAPYLMVCVAAIVAVVVASFVLMSEKKTFAFWETGRGGRFEEEQKECFVKARIESLASVYALTDREREALHLVMQGKTNVAIAHDMFISEGTVKAHLHHIYQKLGVHTRKELTALVESERAVSSERAK